MSSESNEAMRAAMAQLEMQVHDLLSEFQTVMAQFNNRTIEVSMRLGTLRNCVDTDLFGVLTEHKALLESSRAVHEPGHSGKNGSAVSPTTSAPSKASRGPSSPSRRKSRGGVVAPTPAYESRQGVLLPATVS